MKRPPPEVAELRLVTVLAATPPAADNPERLQPASRRDARSSTRCTRSTRGLARAVRSRRARGRLRRGWVAGRRRDARCARGAGARLAGRRRDGRGGRWCRRCRHTRGRARPCRRESGSTSAPLRSFAPSGASTRRSPGAPRSSTTCTERSSPRAMPAAAALSPSSASRASARPASPASWRCAKQTRRRCSLPAASRTGLGVTFLPLLEALRRARPEQALAGEPDAELVLTRLAALAEGAESAPLGESYWAVRRLLEALARTQPVLLVLDDVHWAEPALVDLVDYLADRADARLLVLCLARPELERSLGEPLVLGPLGEEEARAIVAGTAVVDEETRERIVGLAEGNALYAEQLASFAAEGGEGLPPTLEAVLAGRLGRLDAAERSILQRAAVVGREFSLGAVAALADGEVASRPALALARRLRPPRRGRRPGRRRLHLPPRPPPRCRLREPDESRPRRPARTRGRLDRPRRPRRRRDRRLSPRAGCALPARARRERGRTRRIAGERLGEAGMRVWRTNNVNSAVELLTRATVLLPAGSGRAALLLEHALALALQGREGTMQTQALDAAEADARDDIEPRLDRADRSGACRHRTGSAGISQLDVAIATLAESAKTSAPRGGRTRPRPKPSLPHILTCMRGHATTPLWRQPLKRRQRTTPPPGSHRPRARSAICMALYDGSVDVATATARCAELLGIGLGRHDRGKCDVGARGITGVWQEQPTMVLLCSTRRVPLYEDIGVAPWNRVHLDACAHRRRGRRGPPSARGDSAHRRTWTSYGRTESMAYASCRSLMLANLLLRRRRTTSAAEAATAFGEANAFPSDVLTQFLRRSMRARLLARAGDFARAETLAREAVSIASMTDAQPATRGRAPCSCRRAAPRQGRRAGVGARGGSGCCGASAPERREGSPRRSSLHLSRRRSAPAARAAATRHLPHGAPPFVRPRSSGAQTAQSRRPNGWLTAARRWLLGPRSGPFRGLGALGVR